MTQKIIQAKVTGAPELYERITHHGSSVRTRLHDALKDIGNQLSRDAGGRVRTKKGRGRMKRSISSRTFARAETIGVRVEVRRFYARFVEFGTGPVDTTVKAHWRRHRGRSKMGFVAGKASKRAVRVKFQEVAQGIVRVKSFPRRQRTAAKPFLNPALNAMQERILARLLAIVSVPEK